MSTRRHPAPAPEQLAVTAAELEAVTSAACAWRAHRRDGGAFVNSVLAEFGVASAVGRLVTHAEFLNPPLALHLDDRAYDIDPSWDRQWDEEPPPTPAAWLMMASAHRRGAPWQGNLCRRRTPCPPATRAAALAYLDEAIALHRAAEPLLVSPRHRRQLARCLARLTRLRALLVETWGAPEPRS